MRSIFLSFLLVAGCTAKDTDSDDPPETSAPDADFDGWADADDCDSDDPAVNPAADEICNGIDDNCDGEIDEGLLTDFWIDGDGDGFGGEGIEGCSLAPGWVPQGGDCDDNASDVNPDATEVCNGVDDDCNGFVDDNAVDQVGAYADVDGDGAGDPAVMLLVCTPGVGQALVAGDCDDNDAAIGPDAIEICDGIDNNCDGEVDLHVVGAPVWFLDADGDGFGLGSDGLAACAAPPHRVADSSDCDDTDPLVSPAAIEVCNGADDDCDLLIDDDPSDGFLIYPDLDGDGYGAGTSRLGCAADVGESVVPDDCDDGDLTVFPGAPELCDLLDNNCEGQVDEDVVDVTWYADLDGDGYGDPLDSVVDCAFQAGRVTNADDCDDTDASINPELVWYLDADGDGYGDVLNPTAACVAPAHHVADATDCDDTRSAVFPSADEFCNQLDDDCDGAVDEPDAVDVGTFYADGDGDGFGDVNLPQNACFQPVDYVADANDCNDTSASINPGATEICNTIDDDCDGAIDEDAAGATDWYYDGDGDGFGVGSSILRACTLPPHHAALDGDCNDSEATVFPGAQEVCNTVDDDCNELIDDSAIDAQVFYADADADGHGVSSPSTMACSVPLGFSALDDDCNDAESTIYPTAPELCDNLDNDCDLQVDEDVVAQDWYPDADADGFGADVTPTSNCAQPTGFVLNSADCDDSLGDVNPLADEVCNGRDDDCDLLIDIDAVDASTWYIDADGDDHGFASTFVLACDMPANHVASFDDCDDTLNTRFPGNPEVCDGLDNDCNVDVDDGLSFLDYWPDADADSFGDVAAIVPVRTCDGAPSGMVLDHTDCNDASADANPALTEVTCDGLDNDCVLATSDTPDGDGDGVDVCIDCDDSDANNYPSNTEMCDGLDNDCVLGADNGLLFADYWPDSDTDGFGDLATTVPTSTCDGAPAGMVSDQTDCDDTTDLVNPSATEITCDGVDNDCDVLTLDAPDGDGDGSDVCVDCDDMDNNNFPGNPEICDGLDNDCVSGADNGVPFADYWPDDDIDGFGDLATTVPTSTCDGAPTGMVSDHTDCDDTTDLVNPSVPEATCDGVDNDCDVLTLDAPDGDGDGSDVCVDCDDTDINNFPGNMEICDGLDNDCVSGADNGLPFADYWPDSDTDTFGDLATTVPTSTCNGAPSGMVSDHTDCDDTTDLVNPSATEITCDGIDNDCDVLTLDAPDGDGDGSDVCVDCDDSDINNYPGNMELCDGLDNDCVSGADNGLTFLDYWLDTDVDLFGDSVGSPVSACSVPSGRVANNADCDDGDDQINPDASEVCDAVDNNCDTVIDEGFNTDGDPVTTCGPDGVSGNADDDCDDGDNNIYPGNSETCDLQDNNCNLLIDEGLPTMDYYSDQDGDGFGNGLFRPVAACAPPPNTSLDNTDCDDSRDTVYPGALEICDGLDNDCATVTPADPNGLISNIDKLENYAQMADAVAAVGPGETVNICPGTYSSADLLLSENDTNWVGIYGPAATFIQPPQAASGRILSVSGNNTTIRGLQFRNGGVFGTGETGGAIRVAADLITLIDLEFVNNSAPNGGALAFEAEMDLVANQVVLANNSAFEFGGGLYVAPGKVLHGEWLGGQTIRNSAEAGGGGDLYGALDMVFINTAFGTGNSSLGPNWFLAPGHQSALCQGCSFTSPSFAIFHQDASGSFDATPDITCDGSGCF